MANFELYHYTRKPTGCNKPGLWSPRLPDLTPVDLYLKGHMKALVYLKTVHTQGDMCSLIEA